MVEQSANALILEDFLPYRLAILSHTVSSLIARVCERVALVDEFYDRKVKLVLSAAASADSLYQGKRLEFEFQRTSSRLTEMQQEKYLHAPHIA